MEGFEVVYAHPARRDLNARRQAPDQLVEIVDVHAMGWPGSERRPLGCGLTGEIAHDEQPHRALRADRSRALARAEIELEFHASGHGVPLCGTRRRREVITAGST